MSTPALCYGPGLTTDPNTGALMVDGPRPSPWTYACPMDAQNGLRVDPSQGLWVPKVGLAGQMRSEYRGGNQPLTSGAHNVLSAPVIPIVNPSPCQRLHVNITATVHYQMNHSGMAAGGIWWFWPWCAPVVFPTASPPYLAHSRGKSTSSNPHWDSAVYIGEYILAAGASGNLNPSAVFAVSVNGGIIADWQYYTQLTMWLEE